MTDDTIIAIIVTVMLIFNWISNLINQNKNSLDLSNVTKQTDFYAGYATVGEADSSQHEIVFCRQIAQRARQKTTTSMVAI